MSGKDDFELADATRRTVLKGTAGALGVGAMGSASAHEWGSTTTQSGDNNRKPGTIGEHDDASYVGYHSLGGKGNESGRGGQPQNAHEGAVTEIRSHGDYAYVGMFSSRGDTAGRGLAVVDISDYNNAETDADLEAAEMNVVSFLQSNNAATAFMDLKLSDDGNYVFVGTQPISALFNETTKGPAVSLDENSTSGPNTGGVLAVDVTDPFEPTLVDIEEGFTTGVHNLFHHRIEGTDYVFACKDIESDNTAGVYVFEFERTTGQLALVNRWTATGGNNAAGEVTPTGGMDFYCHDVEVQDDPITGKPTLYVAYWNAGVRVLDASDPTAMEEIGHFPMRQAHFTTPAPDTYELPNGEEKRLLIASHEEPSNNRDDSGSGNPVDGKRNPYSTGSVLLVDADGIYEGDGVTELPLLDDYTWQNAAGDPDDDDIEFSNFELSPHNSDIAKHVDPETGETSFWVHQAHYHGGVRFLKVDPRGSSGEFDLVEEAFSRPVQEEVPDASKMQGLSGVTPNIWGCVESNGVTLAADINQGVHAVKADAIPLGGADPVVGTSREMDGSVFRSGATNQVDLTVEFTDEDVLVRERLPNGWEHIGGEGEPVTVGEDTFVQFGDKADAGDSFTYFADVGGSGASTVGPVQVSADGGDSWTTLGESAESVYVLGGGGLTLGAAAGAAGVLGSQRERLGERVRDLLGDD